MTNNHPVRHLPQSNLPPAPTTLDVEQPHKVLQLHQVCELLKLYPNLLRMSQHGERVH